MGVNVKQSFAVTWAISFLVAAVAGILMAPVVFLSTHMGIVVINGFAAAILGGWGSIPGAIIGGMLLGVIDNVAPAVSSLSNQECGPLCGDFHRFGHPPQRYHGYGAIYQGLKGIL